MPFKAFSSYSESTRNVQRELYLQGQRRDAQPSRRTNHVSYLNAEDRAKWHEKVILDRELYYIKNPHITRK